MVFILKWLTVKCGSGKEVKIIAVLEERELQAINCLMCEQRELQAGDFFVFCKGFFFCLFELSSIVEAFLIYMDFLCVLRPVLLE